MKIFHVAFRWFLFILLFSALAFIPWPSQAQDGGEPAPAPVYSQEELAQMLAPVALYPDALLAQVLMASTYPLEIVEADRWVKRNPGLEEQALDDALLNQDWDPSVKAVCHFPSVLSLMSEHITETTDLGNAFLAQESQVMDTVQRLRAKAYDQGNLTSNAQQKVIVEPQQQTIVIEPANPQVIYVPYYDPTWAYGPWWYPAYPPYYWGPPGVSIGIGFSFWPGIYFGFTFGNWCYFNWPLHSIYLNVYYRPRYVRHDRWYNRDGPWHHAPHHRRGVAYRDRGTAEKYGQYPRRSRDYWRDTRGYPERGGLDRDRSRQGEVRSRFDQGSQFQQRNGRVQQQRTTSMERNRQQQQRVERELRSRAERAREQASRERQLRRNYSVGGQIEQRAGQGQRFRQEQPRNNFNYQNRQRSERQQQLERQQQSRQRFDQNRQSTQRFQSEQRQRSRDNVFNQVDRGNRERMSSQRGQFSRQSRSGGDYRSRGSSGGNNNDRGDWGRNKR